MTKTFLTRENILDKVVSAEYYLFPDTTMTVCLLTLGNGFCVLGESACVDPANFDAEKGKTLAFVNALNKVWELEGYLLKERLHAKQNP